LDLFQREYHTVPGGNTQTKPKREIAEKKAVGKYQLKETFPKVDLEKSESCKPKANIKASKLPPLPK
jgi:hypothetical protein